MNMLTKLKLIKHQCDEHKVGCDNCPYLVKGAKWDKCKVKEICYSLCNRPCSWDIEKIEEMYNA